MSGIAYHLTFALAKLKYVPYCIKNQSAVPEILSNLNTFFGQSFKTHTVSS